MSMMKASPVTAQQAVPSTAGQILDVAERMVQVNGFNGFSYADVAAELSLTKPALHYHYSGKYVLGRALIERYAERFMDSLRGIDARMSASPAKLRAYADLYGAVLREHRMCLCGMLAAEYETLPEAMREAVLAFFDANEAWLAGVLEAGLADGTLAFTGAVPNTARMLVGALEGAMLVARPYGDLTRFEVAADQLLAGLLPAT